MRTSQLKETRIEDLAEYLILYFNAQDIEITQIRLQKLLYYIQAWHLAYFDKDPLFHDVPEAWMRGPVFRRIYDLYNDKGSEPIVLTDESEEDVSIKLKERKEILGLSDNQHKFIEAVVKKYGFMSLSKLLYKVHAEPPWNQARKGLSDFEYSNQKVSHDIMYEYFNGLLKKVEEQNA